MPTLRIPSGFDLFYSDLAPDGHPCVILLHGLGATSESWGYQIPSILNQGFRILVPDMRGFGKSPYTGGDHSITDMASDIIEMMNWECIDTAHLVGISMGGAVALQLACDHNSRFEKLVLVNTFARLRPNSIQGWFYFAIRLGMIHILGLPTQARFVASRLFPNPDQEHLRQMFIEQVIQSDPQGYRATMRALMHFNLESQVSNINNDTLVITGAKDFTVPLSVQKFIVDQLSYVRHIVLDEAGHAVTVEKPVQINRILVEFLAN